MCQYWLSRGKWVDGKWIDQDANSWPCVRLASYLQGNIAFHAEDAFKLKTRIFFFFFFFFFFLQGPWQNCEGKFIFSSTAKHHSFQFNSKNIITIFVTHCSYKYIIKKILCIAFLVNQVIQVFCVTNISEYKKHGNAMKPGFQVTTALYLLKLLASGSLCDECIMIYFKTSSFSKLARILQSNWP